MDSTPNDAGTAILKQDDRLFSDSAVGGAARRSILATILAPAVALTGRLGYCWKLALLGFMSFLGIVVVMVHFLAVIEPIMRTGQRELDGIPLIKPFSRAIQLIQQHRGLSNALIGGAERISSARTAKEAEAAEALGALEKALPPNLSSMSEFQRIKDNWERISIDGGKWTREENFAAHTRLIDQIRSFEVVVADEYALTLEPGLGTYYLINSAIQQLPTVLERLGQVRAYGTAILVKREATAQQKLHMNTLLAQLGDSLNILNVNLQKAGRLNPDMNDSILLVSRSVNESAQPIIDLVTSDILAGRFSTNPSIFFGVASAGIDKGYTQLYEALLPMSESMVTTRIARVKNALFASIGLAFVLIAVLVYFSIGVCYSIIGNIQLLARAARAFARGDTQTRIKLGTRDELSRMGDSFNEMADGFNILLEARRDDDVRMGITIETAMDAVVRIDAEGFIIGWNSQAEKTFGWTRGEAIGLVLSDTIIPPSYREKHLQGIKRYLETGKGAILNSRVEVFGLHRDGHEFPAELSIAPLRVGGKFEFSAFIRDITERRKAEERIEYLAYFDALTGLPNRTQLNDRARRAIHLAQRNQGSLALMFLDVDRFKDINDSLGHSVGDALLIALAERLRVVIRDEDTVSRLGGDEFIFLLNGVDALGAANVAQKLLDAVANVCRIGQHDLNVTCSIGIALYPCDGTDLETLSKNADVAMYRAKQEGREGFCFFTEDMQKQLERHMLLVNALRHALERDQLDVHYQPQISMCDGRIVGAEALLRWTHPQLGVVSPAEFIPIAEESGLILPMGEWVLRRAARQARVWMEAGLPPMVMAVNLSAIQFRHPDLLAMVSRVLLQEELATKYLELELTEGAAMQDPEGAIAVMNDLHERGVRMSIDDFGTGYSSLSQLKKFKIYKLKIDQSFVRDIDTDPEDRAIVCAIINMAKSLGLKTIAEGVETAEQLAFLREHGCDETQGYYHSRPLSAVQFESFARDKMEEAMRAQTAAGDIADAIDGAQEDIPYFTWNEDLSLGSDVIDDDHRKLIELINDLHTAIKQGWGRDVLGSVLNTLVKYTKEHFEREEKFMHDIRYGDFQRHKQDHDMLIQKVRALQKKFNDGEAMPAFQLLAFLVDDLVNHIMSADRKLASAACNQDLACVPENRISNFSVTVGWAVRTGTSVNSK